MKRQENNLIYKLKGDITEFDGNVVTVATDSKGNIDDLSIEDLAKDIKDFIEKIGESTIDISITVKEVK